MNERNHHATRRAAIGLALTLVMISSARATETAMTPATHIESAFPFDDTVTRLRGALEAHGFKVFAVIDQKAAAKSVDLDMPPTTLIVYGNPKGGTALMLAAPDFAIELPLKVLIREDAGRKTLVVYNPASSLEGRHGLPAGLATKLGAAESLMAEAVGAGSPKAR